MMLFYLLDMLEKETKTHHVINSSFNAMLFWYLKCGLDAAALILT